MFFRARYDVCPGVKSCSQCGDLGSQWGDCDESCKLCPLCKLFYVDKCVYCKDGAGGFSTPICQSKCKEGQEICQKCTKHC